MAGLFGTPKLGDYSASKFALMGLSETLRLEASQEVPHIFALDLRPLLTDFYIFECYLEYRGFLRVLR